MPGKSRRTITFIIKALSTLLELHGTKRETEITDEGVPEERQQLCHMRNLREQIVESVSAQSLSPLSVYNSAQPVSSKRIIPISSDQSLLILVVGQFVP